MATGEMRIMDHTGDTKIIWDKNVPAEVEHARDTFKKFKDKRYLAYSVESGGAKGTILKEFDPNIQSMILSPPLAGG